MTAILVLVGLGVLAFGGRAAYLKWRKWPVPERRRWGSDEYDMIRKPY